MPIEFCDADCESISATRGLRDQPGDSFLPVTKPAIGDDEAAAIMGVLRSGWIGCGPEVGALEEEFAASVGRQYALACHSGAAALDIAMEAIGIGPGDEVIVPSLTFTATAASVCARGARVVFADIHSHSDLTLSPVDIERCLTKQTRAVIFVPYGGYAGQLADIEALCRSNDLTLIQDACHAPGAQLNGRDIGSYGAICTYSLHSTKNISSGEGGLVVFDNGEWTARLRAFRSHGVVREQSMTHDGADYVVQARATNLRMSDITASLARAQLNKLELFNTQRRNLSTRYDQLLATSEVTRPFSDQRKGSAAHLFPILLPQGCDRRTVRRYMLSTGIETAVHFVALHKQPAYADFAGTRDLPITEDVAARITSLPLHPSLIEGDIRRVVNSLQEALRQATEKASAPIA